MVDQLIIHAAGLYSPARFEQPRLDDYAFHAGRRDGGYPLLDLVYTIAQLIHILARGGGRDNCPIDFVPLQLELDEGLGIRDSV